MNILEEILKKFYEYFRILGLIPGKEFLVAMEEAEKIGAQVIMGDRNVLVKNGRGRMGGQIDSGWSCTTSLWEFF
jgi:pheromone shutdown protein TraB